MSADLLAIYLSDHLAGATAGSRRMRRLAEAERDASDAAELSRVADEIEEDRATLLSVMNSVGATPQWYKTALAQVGERAGLLKLNGAVFHRSPLTSVVELEAIRMGVIGKHSMWSALRHTDLRTSFDFDDLIQRAERQLQVIVDAHGRRASVVAQRDASGAAQSSGARSNEPSWSSPR
jgi:hypothetical protein